MADLPIVAAAKFEKLAKDLGSFQKTVVLSAAKTVQTAVRAELVAAGAGSGRLRGVGKKGAPIGVRYDTLAPTQVIVRATGQWQFIESDTKAHREPKVRGARARKRVLVIPGVGVRAWANHPGTKGKHPWAKGVAAAAPLVTKSNEAAILGVLTGVFH